MLWVLHAPSDRWIPFKQHITDIVLFILCVLVQRRGKRKPLQDEEALNCVRATSPLSLKMSKFFSPSYFFSIVLLSAKIPTHKIASNFLRFDQHYRNLKDTCKQTAEGDGSLTLDSEVGGSILLWQLLVCVCNRLYLSIKKSKNDIF